MKSRLKKGFTLTELIIVIAVIAILSAILIPSIIGYVKKAKISSDISNAKNMNTLLLEYYNGDIPSNIEATDIRYAIQQEDSRYNFIPKAVSEGYSYWYDRTKKNIIVSKAEDLVPKAASKSQETASIEEIIEGYFLLDVSGSNLADVLYSLRSITGRSEYTEIKNAFTKENNVSTTLLDSIKGFTDEQIHNLANHIALFDPNHTLYINDFGSFTTSSGNVNHIVFNHNILTIPTNASQNITAVNGIIKLPESVKFIEPGALVTIESASGLIINDISSIRISRVLDDPKSTNNSFSQKLLELIGSKAEDFLEMRSVPIASVETLLSYDLENKKVQEGLEYIPYNLSISPHVTITQAKDGYHIGDKVFIDKWRVKYTSNSNKTITMDVKMFDEVGIIASKTIVYREIYDINMSLDNATLTFDNIARLIYKDESDANDSAGNYQYKIYIGNDSTNVSTYNASDISGTIGTKDLGILEGAYSSLSDAQTKINELYEMANSVDRYYIKAPVISKSNNLWQLSYTFKTSGNTNSEGILQNSQKKDTSSGNEITREDLYEIRLDDTITTEEKYYIMKTSTESGLTYDETNIYYYAHDDKSDINKFDGLSNTFKGTQYLTTNIYDKIQSSSLANYKDQIDEEGNLKVTIILCDQDGNEIIKKSQKFKTSVSNRVYHENVTDGQSQQFLYEFSEIPSYYNLNYSILDLYQNVFTRSFVYKGKRQPIRGDKEVDYTINPGDPGYGYEAFDDIYNLDDVNSKGYKILIDRLKELVEVGKIQLSHNETVETLLEKAYFVKNTAPDEKIGSVKVKPSIYDPYFLVIGLDNSIVGERNMLLVGIFDQLAADGNSSATSRMIEFKYRVAESDKLEITKLNGRDVYGVGTSEDNPFYVYKDEINSELYLNGLTQLRIVNNSIASLGKMFSNNVVSQNYKFRWQQEENANIVKLKIGYYPNYVSFYNETILYCQVIERQDVEISTINDRDATLTDTFVFYEGENIGLTSLPSNYVIGSNVNSIQLLSLNSNTNTSTIYQTVMTVTRNNLVDKYYFIRGDKVPGNEIDLANLSGLSKVGNIENCNPNYNDNTNDYYYCKDYYYQFVKDGKTYTYYPYAIASPNLNDEGGKRSIVPNPLQYFVIIQRSDGSYEFELFDTSIYVGKASNGIHSYLSQTKDDIQYWVNMNLKDGDKGTIGFDTYRYYYFRADSLYVKPNEYYYAGQSYENWLLYDHFYSHKQFEVVSNDVIQKNIHNMLINSSTVTWNAGKNETTIGSVLFDADELIQSKYRTYIQLAYPSQVGIQTIYANNNKNKYYLKMYLDNLSTPLDFDDPTIFNEKTRGTIIVKVYWYGLELEYYFKYEVVDYLDLQLDYVLNDKNYNQVFEIEASQKLISSISDGYTILHLYDKLAPLVNVRDIRISDNGVEVTIYDESGNFVAIVPREGTFKTMEEMGCQIGKNYKATITYASAETSFDFTVVSKKTINDARIQYMNGRYVSNLTSNSNQKFYFLTDEKLKLVYGYEVGNTTYQYTKGYINNNWLSVYVYPTHTSGKYIDLLSILGEYNEMTSTFSNVHFYLDDVVLENEIKFKQEYYAHLDYDASNTKVEYAYYYRVSEESLEKGNKLIIQFSYEGKTYQAEMLYEVVDYYFENMNEDTSAYLAPELTNSTGKTSPQIIAFDPDDSLIFGTSKMSDGYIAFNNRWLTRILSANNLVNGNPQSTDQKMTIGGQEVYYTKSTSGIAQSTTSIGNYDNRFESMFSKIYIEGFDENNQNVTNGQYTIYEKVENNKTTHQFLFIRYPNMIKGTLSFVYQDGSIHYYDFVIREDINDEDTQNAHFIRVNNYYLDNYLDNTIPNYNIKENEEIHIANAATQILLPCNKGKSSLLVSAPDIVTDKGLTSDSGYYSGYIVQYYLSTVSASAITDSDYEYQIEYGVDKGIDGVYFTNSDKWTRLKKYTNPTRINVWDCWPEGSQDAMLCLLYRYSDGNIYTLKLRLTKSISSSVEIGIRRINNAYYYPDLNDTTKVVLDANNLNISLSQSSLYYTYNASYKTTIGFNSTAKYSYSLDNGNTWILLEISNGEIVLPMDVFVIGQIGKIKIDDYKINNISYNDIIFDFIVSQYTGKITKLNNMLVDQNGSIKVFRNEIISTSYVSVFNYQVGLKQVTQSFREYIHGTTDSIYFYYYYEIANGLKNENIHIETTDEETIYKYNWNGYLCDVIEDDGMYYYLIPDTSKWSFEENGKLKVLYKPSPSAPLAYVAYLDIVVVDKVSIDNEIINSLYYDLLDDNFNSISGYKPLKTTSMNTNIGNSWDNPLKILKLDISNGEQFYKMILPNVSNTSFKYYRANGNVETVYANNINMKAMIYDVSNTGDMLNGQTFIFGETSLYNNEQFSNTRYEENYGDIYYTNTKAIVLSYELYGITYSVTFYYYFSSK